MPVAGGASSSQVHVLLRAHAAAVSGFPSGSDDAKLAAAAVAESALEQLLADETIGRTVSRGFALSASAASVDEVVSCARKAWRAAVERRGRAADAVGSFRVFASPRAPLEEEISKALAQSGCAIDEGALDGAAAAAVSPPTKRRRADAPLALRRDRNGFAWALFVIQMADTFVYGWAHVRDALRRRLASTVAVTHQSLGLPCRAAWKLLEVFRRSPSFARFRNAAAATAATAAAAVAPTWWSAIDVGSSPGGWSYAMAQYDSCKEVYAVDPGEMATPVPAKVVHLAERIEQCTPRLVAQNWRADVMTNDMNAHPRITVDALCGLLPLLNPGSRVVLTLKNFAGGRKAMDRAVANEMRRLRAILHHDTIEVLHLMANGPQERTVVGVVKCMLPKTFGLPPRARATVLAMLRGDVDAVASE